VCGETRIPRDMCAGKRDPRGNTYHCDTGFCVSHQWLRGGRGENTKAKGNWIVLKCSLCRESVSYLGHVVSREGVAMNTSSGVDHSLQLLF